jgi:hypothetical protein
MADGPDRMPVVVTNVEIDFWRAVEVVGLWFGALLVFLAILSVVLGAAAFVLMGLFSAIS